MRHAASQRFSSLMDLSTSAPREEPKPSLIFILYEQEERHPPRRIDIILRPILIETSNIKLPLHGNTRSATTVRKKAKCSIDIEHEAQMPHSKTPGAQIGRKDHQIRRSTELRIPKKERAISRNTNPAGIIPKT